MCRNFIDHVPLTGYWASLRNQIDAKFLDQLNVNSAQHSCMVSELRLRYEHEISVKEIFEKKFVKSAKTIQQRDAKIVGLKSRLEKAEVEAVEAGVLHRRVSELKATATTRQKSFRGLGVQNVELMG
ncbi:hypothetical protein Tco_0712911 [Tanacetum coccineum]